MTTLFHNPEDNHHQMGVIKISIIILMLTIFYKVLVPRLFPTIVSGKTEVVFRKSISGELHLRTGGALQGGESEAVESVLINGGGLSSILGGSHGARSKAKSELRKRRFLSQNEV
eukprot:Tbor_TRINITY_DN6083_c1_g2::TRINITY_DN6083_c1_g2_i1::g.11431::m.11431